MERLLDMAAWLTANNTTTNCISENRRFLSALHNRLLENFNEVPTLCCSHLVTEIFSHLLLLTFHHFHLVFYLYYLC